MGLTISHYIIQTDWEPKKFRIVQGKSRIVWAISAGNRQPYSPTSIITPILSCLLLISSIRSAEGVQIDING